MLCLYLNIHNRCNVTNIYLWNVRFFIKQVPLRIDFKSHTRETPLVHFPDLPWKTSWRIFVMAHRSNDKKYSTTPSFIVRPIRFNWNTFPRHARRPWWGRALVKLVNISCAGDHRNPINQDTYGHAMWRNIKQRNRISSIIFSKKFNPCQWFSRRYV